MNPPDDLSQIPVTGLLGHGISYSLSPMLHAAADRASGRSTDFQLFDISPMAVDGFLNQVMKFGEIVGFNVTVPHKEYFYNRLNDLDDSAKGVGAVNTVVVDGDQLIGHNTDSPAFASVIRAALTDGGHPASDWTVVILGSGGAARAVVRAVLDLGIAKEVVILNRSEDRKFFMLAHIQEAFDEKRVLLKQHDWLEWGSLGEDHVRAAHATMLINTTPLGRMDPDGKIRNSSPVPPVSVLREFSLVIDLVYFPPITELMKAAANSGVQAVGGSGMLIEQAVLSRALWFGKGMEDTERAAMIAAYSSWSKKVSEELLGG